MYQHWDFGDGETSDEKNPSHTYQTIGEHVVTFTVTDNDDLIGNDSTICLIVGFIGFLFIIICRL
jgi:PKD repeat protein